MMTDFDKVIKALESCRTSNSMTECTKTDSPYYALDDHLRYLFDDALALLKEQEEQVQIANEEGFYEGYMQAMSEASPWISVEDQLPENKQIVIVSDGVHTWDVGQYNGLCYIPGDNLQKDFWHWKKNTVKTVKWWMPKECALPQPPSEEY